MTIGEITWWLFRIIAILIFTHSNYYIYKNFKKSKRYDNEIEFPLYIFIFGWIAILVFVLLSINWDYKIF